MLTTVSGTFKEGKVELLEEPEGLGESAVLVTFLDADASGPLTRAQSAEMRGRLGAWEEDWNAPGMETYDEL